MSYDTLDLYGKFEGSWKIVVEPAKEGQPGAKPAAVELSPVGLVPTNPNGCPEAKGAQ